MKKHVLLSHLSQKTLKPLIISCFSVW